MLFTVVMGLSGAPTVTPLMQQFLGDTTRSCDFLQFTLMPIFTVLTRSSHRKPSVAGAGGGQVSLTYLKSFNNSSSRTEVSVAVTKLSGEEGEVGEASFR